MAQKNPFADFFAQNDFSKLLESYQGVPFDLKALLETQRRNIQAISEANQISVGHLQTIAHRQAEILSQIVEDNSSLAKELMTEGTPEEKIAKNAKLFKGIYERTVGNMKELSDMINKSNQEASAIINKRVAATMNEIQSSLEKAPSGKKAAA